MEYNFNAFNITTLSGQTVFRRKKLSYIFSILLIPVLLLFSAIPSSSGLNVNKETLDNGLTLLVTERHNLPLVIVSIGIMAGSLVEPVEKSGLANLTAGLLNEGTSNRTGRQISEEIEFVGGSLGASGGDDYITVSLSILKKDLSLGFELLADIILNPVFSEEELQKRVKRIKAALKSREDDPGFVASKAFIKEVYGDHPYGRLVQGSEETLDMIKREDLVKFHSDLYVPDNSVMSVVGDITTTEVKVMLGRYFSGWKAGDLTLPASSSPEVLRKSKTIAIDRDLVQANIIIGHAGIRRDDPDYYAMSVMNYILGGGGFASRLMQSIREELGLAYSVYSSVNSLKEGGSFRIRLQTKNESANTVIEEIVREMTEMRNLRVSDTELSDAKAFLTGVFPVRIETSRRIVNFLVATEVYGLGTGYIDEYPIYINAVTKEDIFRVAREYLHPDEYILVIVADQDKASLKEKYR
jgi:zinc protease